MNINKPGHAMTGYVAMYFLSQRGMEKECQLESIVVLGNIIYQHSLITQGSANMTVLII